MSLLKISVERSKSPLKFLVSHNFLFLLRQERLVPQSLQMASTLVHKIAINNGVRAKIILDLMYCSIIIERVFKSAV